MLPPAKLRRLTRGRHIFHESLDPYKQDGPKKHQKNQLHLYRWINPRVKPMWIRPFCWGFHITSLFIPIDGSSPWCGWMQAEVLSESPEVWMGPSRSGWTVKTNKKSNEEKLIQESGTNVINYIWHLICILYRIPPQKKNQQFFVDHHLCFVVVGCFWMISSGKITGAPPKVSLVSLGGVKLKVRRTELPTKARRPAAWVSMGIFSEIMASNRVRFVGFSMENMLL